MTGAIHARAGQRVLTGQSLVIAGLVEKRTMFASVSLVPGHAFDGSTDPVGLVGAVGALQDSTGSLNTEPALTFYRAHIGATFPAVDCTCCRVLCS